VLGQVADAVVLSFGRDKILDGVLGGAVVFSNHSSADLILPQLNHWFELKIDLKNKCRVLTKLIYPSLMLTVRLGYLLGFGKALHFLLKKIKLIDSPILSYHDHYQSFPAYFAPLVWRKWQALSKQLAHRRQIVQYYWQELAGLSRIKLLCSQQQLDRATNLRFPLLLESQQDLKSLLGFLKKRRIFVEDRWYRQAVDSGSYPFSSSYQLGDCPWAEELSTRIINLPTHQLIKQKQAQYIVDTIKKWADLQ
jgi:dTDP-4-amino-4,6-dideoxygalactose transaminase